MADPSGLLQVLDCPAPGMVTVTSPVHRVVIVFAPFGKEYVPLAVILTVVPSGMVPPGEIATGVVAGTPPPLELPPSPQADTKLKKTTINEHKKI
ncbi:MAG: hypothetical protein OEU36_15430 [Gammaproteobacteria bacterium]|nr:hypothetical protein [Gammaproteobacteria bacterium]